MDNIRLAAKDLAKKRSSLCPGCGTPGFWIVERVAGFPCAHRETREQTDRQYAEPGRCDSCNP